jgi:hypothetical protein
MDMDANGNKFDIIFFDDGSHSCTRKQGHIVKIENGLIYFEEYGKIQLIPVNRIFRVEKGDYEK